MKPKKSLGQNFLKDTKVLEKIIQAANLNADDFVIEIGPGQGALTDKLIKSAEKVIAIEIDRNLSGQLKNRYKKEKNIEILEGDVMKMNLPEILEKKDSKNYKVVANIPYYITSPIIQLFLETKHPPKSMTIMIQKEVAERICARPGKMSILAVSVQYRSTPEFLFEVGRNSFWPAPEVDSAVIRISSIKNNIPEDDSKKFFRTLKAGFSSKRKTLLNNIANSFHLEKKTVEEKIKKAGVNPSSRAQNLSIDDWKKMSKIF